MTKNRKMSEPIRIDVQRVLELLAEGKSRKEIAADLGITLKLCREVVFQDPRLKGKRPAIKRAGPVVELYDSSENTEDEVGQTPDSPIVSESTEEAKEEVEEQAEETAEAPSTVDEGAEAIAKHLDKTQESEAKLAEEDLQDESSEVEEKPSQSKW